MLGRLIQYVRGVTSISWSSVGILVSHRRCGGKALGLGLLPLAAQTSLIWGATMSLKIDVIDYKLLRV